MQHYERPPEEIKKLISNEKAGSFKYLMVRIGFIIGVIGTIAFLIGFFYQNVFNQAGIPYRQAQFIAITIVFIGWVLFMVFCTMLGINTRKLTYSKLMSILRNEVEVPLNEALSARKQVAATLNGINNQWALFPEAFADDPKKTVPMILSGPGGVYGITMNQLDPRKANFIDPAAPLAAGCAELEKQLATPVEPIVGFTRSTKHYKCTVPDVKVFTLQELYAFVDSRTETLTAADLGSVEKNIRYVTNLGKKV